MEEPINTLTVARWWFYLSFIVYPYSNKHSDWPEGGGVYIFSGLPNPDNLQGINPVYVGETENFQTRLPHHENWKVAHSQYNATHVHVMIEEDPGVRLTLEKHLIRSLRPPLNKKGL